MSKDKPQEYGDGGLYQRGDGMWVGTLEAGWTEKGKRRRIYVYGKTEAVAKRKLRDKRLALEREDAGGKSDRATVKSWADEWLTIVERTLAPNAYTSTRTGVMKWIVPTIGPKRLNQLSPADVRAVATAQRDAGRKSSTQRRTHSVLMQLLKAAAAEGYAVPQRLLVLKPPAVSVHDRTDMSVGEAVAVLEQASRLPYGSRFVAAFLQGMRQGECNGLTWPQVDLDGNSLTISWQLQSLHYKHGCPGGTCGAKRPASCSQRVFRVPDGYEARQVKGAQHLVRPKSKKGWRVLPLVPWMRSSLEAWREVAPENPHQLVWLTIDGEPRYYKDDDAEWYGLQEAAGVRHPSGRLYTIHEARHTTAQLLLEAGVDPVVITAILGHSSIVTSRGYMHAKQTHTLAAMEAVATRLQLTPRSDGPAHTA